MLLEWRHFPSHAVHYASWLAALLTPLVFPIGFIALLGKTTDAFARATLAVWFAAIFLFYCFYGPYDTWWYTRFLLPAAPPLILGFLLAAAEITAGWRPAIRAIGLAVPIAIILLTAVHFVRKKFILHTNEAAERTARAIPGALKLLPPKRLLICNSLGGAFYYYTGEMTLRSEWIDPPDFEQLRAYAFLAGRPIYALVDDQEAVDLFRRAPGTWREVARFRHVSLYRHHGNAGEAPALR